MAHINHSGFEIQKPQINRQPIRWLVAFLKAPARTIGAKRWLWPALIGWLLASSVGAVPARAQYTFDFWTTDNGLPQNSITAIIQTRDGYLWLATFDGLVRYDGVCFTVFDKSSAKGLTTNRFTALFEDTDGALFIGTVDGGLTRYQNGTFTSFTMHDGLPHNQVFTIQRDGDRLLITTLTGYAYWHDGQIWPDPEGKDPRTCAVYIGPSGARWTLDASGLHRFTDGAVTTYPIPVGTSSLGKELPGNASRKSQQVRGG